MIKHIKRYKRCKTNYNKKLSEKLKFKCIFCRKKINQEKEIKSSIKYLFDGLEYSREIIFKEKQKCPFCSATFKQYSKDFADLL